MALKTISLQLDEALLARIDELRGDVPRQRWVGRILAEAAARVNPKPNGSAPPSLEPSGRAPEPPAAPPKSAASAPRKGTAAPESRSEMFARATQKGKR